MNDGLNEYFNVYLTGGIDIIDEIVLLNKYLDYLNKKKNLIQLREARIVSWSTVEDLDRVNRLRKKQLKNHE